MNMKVQCGMMLCMCLEIVYTRKVCRNRRTISSRKSKDRRYNSQNETKATVDNVSQNNVQQLMIEIHKSLLNPVINSVGPEARSCFSRDTRRVAKQYDNIICTYYVYTKSTNSWNENNTLRCLVVLSLELLLSDLSVEHWSKLIVHNDSLNTNIEDNN